MKKRKTLVVPFLIFLRGAFGDDEAARMSAIAKKPTMTSFMIGQRFPQDLGTSASYSFYDESLFGPEDDSAVAQGFDREMVCRLPTSCTADTGYCASMRGGFDVLIPTYPPELCKVELLARSVARLDVCGLIRDVHIPWVSDEPFGAYVSNFERIQVAFGSRYKIYFHEPRPDPLPGGWFEQQIVKLWAYTYVKTPWYLVMDSKNVFVNPITLRSLFARQRMSIRTIDNLPMKKWYLGSADMMGVDIPTSASLKPTITPAIFNVARVRSFFEWLDSNKLSLKRILRSLVVSEFALYEVFTCCNPARRGEKDPWLVEPLAQSVPFRLYMVWTVHTTESKRRAEIEYLEDAVVNRTRFDELLVVGWHHSFPKNNISKPFVKGLADIYVQSKVLQQQEKCAFFAKCAPGIDLDC